MRCKRYMYIIRQDGNVAWTLNGAIHRDNGPAIELVNGTKYWYKDGLLHREDGPAKEWPDGFKEWYLEGELVFPEGEDL